MINEIPPFSLPFAIGYWVVIVLACSLVALLVGLIAALVAYGKSGPKMVRLALSRAFRDLFFLSGQRILAIGILTFKESQRRKAFAIGFLFILLFMFGGWFLGSSDAEKPAKPYISFVMTSMNFLLILMSILISCWGLPADIKARSLHTVVTKPVRRSEIVLGRMFGYIGVLTLVLAATSVLGYLWIARQVPDSAKDQLIARVPLYGSYEFLDRNGNKARSGINVGDIWNYRSFIEGGTKARAIWTFKGLNVRDLERQGEIRLEQNFEAFRTYKGIVDEQVRYSLTLINPNSDLRVPAGTYSVEEFKLAKDAALVRIPRKLTYRESYEVDAPEREVDLFDDIIFDRSLMVEVACVDAQQHIGMALNDLFIRLPDKLFITTYAKACFGLWLLLTLVVLIGTTGSCFLKGPVATIFTAGLIFVGFVFKGTLQDILDQLLNYGRVTGGGTFESLYRLVTQMNVTSELPSNPGTDFIKLLDQGVFGFMRVVHGLIPDLQYFSTSAYPANGFDVPWDNALLPAMAITLGYFIPMVVLGYFSLQLRELESK